MSDTTSRFRVLNDQQWETVERLLPSSNSRRVVEGSIYRYLTGMPWRDLPRDEFGTWDAVLTYLLTVADTEGKIDWNV